MSYAGERRCYDADSHLMETDDWLARYTDPNFRDRLRRLGPESLRATMRDALAFTRLRQEEEWLRERAESEPFGAVGWAAPGAVDPAERSRTLDVLGFDAQLVFSTYAIGQFLGCDDPEVRAAGARAHNRGVVDFCSADPRLLPVGLVPLDDGESAKGLLDDALACGVAAVWIPPVPPRSVSPSHPDFDPFWAALQDADTPFLLHVGTDGKQLDPVFNRTGLPAPPDFIGGGENMRAKDFMVTHHLPQTVLSVLVLDGVLDRFPRLRGACIENGAAWVGAWLTRLEMAFKVFRRTEPAIAGLSLSPAEFVHRQLKFTPFTSEPVGALIRQAGGDLFMFSSDYPHPEGGRDPLGSFDAALDGLPASDLDRFYRRNFAELMGSRLAPVPGPDAAAGDPDPARTSEGDAR